MTPIANIAISPMLLQTPYLLFLLISCVLGDLSYYLPRVCQKIASNHSLNGVNCTVHIKNVDTKYKRKF